MTMSAPDLSLIDASSLVLAPLDTRSIPAARLSVRLAPREEAAILLTQAAEVEHALMAQYLYAAYAVRRQHDQQRVRNQSALLRRFMLQLAREEMGHLMSVQNLLRLIGAPLHLGGMTAQIHPGALPFRYTLEPLSTRSLAKYITAERPARVADPILRDKLERIADIARQANAGQPVAHIGAIYERLRQIFEAELDDSHFHDDPDSLQARWDDWGYDDTDRSPHQSRKVLVCHAAVAPGSGSDQLSLRQQAVAALRQIGEQGEGYPEVADCHYQRLLHLYDLVAALESQGFVHHWPVAVNPTTRRPDTSARPEALHGQEPSASYIESERSRDWAQLFNLRYRLLLGYTRHFLHSPGPRYENDAEALERLGDYTPRGLLLRGAFDEMRHLRQIAMKLVTMPLRDGDTSVHAGPTFELRALPGEAGAGDTAAMTATGSAAARPSRPSAWAQHRALIDASAPVIQALLAGDEPPNPFLQDLERADRQIVEALDALAAGQPIPEHLHPREFQKVANIIEQAARGFTVPGHGNFWTGVSCVEFTTLNFFGQRYLGYDAKEPERYRADNSLFFSAVSGFMPRYRPQIPASRQEFIRQWIDAQAPDSDPLHRIGAHHERSAIDDDEPER
ncbi:MAG TPA: ferritin-like domain-containing protein [Haliangium sp.]|nr:ferritin-like domain-containing protein [Haliangium sp.]